MSSYESVVNLWPQALMTLANFLFSFPFKDEIIYYRMFGGGGVGRGITHNAYSSILVVLSFLSPSYFFPQTLIDKQVMTALDTLGILLIAGNKKNKKKHWISKLALWSSYTLSISFPLIGLTLNFLHCVAETPC